MRRVCVKKRFLFFFKTMGVAAKRPTLVFVASCFVAGFIGLVYIDEIFEFFSLV